MREDVIGRREKGGHRREEGRGTREEVGGRREERGGRKVEGNLHIYSKNYSSG